MFLSRRQSALLLACLPWAAYAQTTGGRDHELQHIAATLSYGEASLEMSRMALSKTTQARVQEFAAFEIAEQETLVTVLNGIGGARNSIAPQRQPKIEDRMALERLQNLSSGFEQAYIEAQIALHRQLLKLNDDYLSKGRDPSLMAVSMLTRGKINEHLAVLEALPRDPG